MRGNVPSRGRSKCKKLSKKVMQGMESAGSKTVGSEVTEVAGNRA